MYIVVEENNGDILYVQPFVYALMTHKRIDSYVRILREIQAYMNNEDLKWEVQNVSMDFEGAEIAAFQQEMPHVRITGCNFHWNQALWKHIQHLGFVKEYKMRGEFYGHVQRICALAHIPTGDVEDGFVFIMEESPDDIMPKV